MSGESESNTSNNDGDDYPEQAGVDTRLRLIVMQSHFKRFLLPNLYFLLVLGLTIFTLSTSAFSVFIPILLIMGLILLVITLAIVVFISIRL